MQQHPVADNADEAADRVHSGYPASAGERWVWAAKQACARIMINLLFPLVFAKG